MRYLLNKKQKYKKIEEELYVDKNGYVTHIIWENGKKKEEGKWEPMKVGFLLKKKVYYK